MNRQTDLTLEEIMKQLRTQSAEDVGCRACHSGGAGFFPPCLLANEAGVMAANGDLVAEAFLCELMLCGSDMSLQAISYTYLKDLPCKQPGTEEAIKAFVADPQNVPIISMVEEKEAWEQEELRRLADKHLPGNA